MRPCPSCGALLPEDATFCMECGKRTTGKRERHGRAAAKGARKPSKRDARKDMKQVAGKTAVSCTNELAGFTHLFENGLAESTEGVFSLTMAFTDISYESERRDVKEDIFEKFSQVHALFPVNTCYQLNLLNLPSPKRDVKRYLPEEGPNADIARSYNEILEERQRAGRLEFERNNYITFSVAAEDDHDALRKLSVLEDSVAQSFNRLNVRARRLDGMERAALVHRMAVGSASPFLLDYDRLATTRKEHVRDFVSPAWAAYGENDKQHKAIIMPGRIVKSYHIRDFGSDLQDAALRTLRALPIPMNISLLFRPQPKSETVKQILSNIDAVQAEMIDYSRSMARSGGDPTLMPPALENKEAAAREQLEFIQEMDQTASWFQGIITIWAENADKLAEYEDMLMSEKGNWSLDIVDMPQRQEPAFAGAMPFATPRLDKAYRSLTTAEGAAMMPFVSQTISDNPKSSYMIGVDRASGMPVLVNPNRLKSPHGWLFGITGGGKSMQINSMLSYSMLQNPRTMPTDDGWAPASSTCPQWHVFDFHEEYVELCRLFGGIATYFGPGHDNSLNPMAMSNAEGELTLKDVRANTDFFLALFESMMDRTLSQREKGKIDSCLSEVFEPYIGTAKRPTLVDLYESLRSAADEEDPRTHERTAAAEVAEELADSLMMYVTGSMNSFAKQTNVGVSPHLNVYVMSELGTTMQTLAMMSAIQHVKTCTYANYAHGKPTYLIIEECQILFDNDAAVRVIESLFAEMRKYGLHIICVTQLPNRVLSHPRAVNLFENSGLFIFLPQQAENADNIATMFSLSSTQADCISLSADVGTGLVIADGVKIAFRNTIPKNSLCYKVWNTDSDKHVKSNDASAKDDYRKMYRDALARIEELEAELAAAKGAREAV